ncbi:hypothetical protein [Luteipulveratus mongoliensis]|uniref:hypothetical protein n=1 Tax=Luteipulveratus mongoliensis TaxID=571913 RepID=UPI0012ED9CB6|nr:hypothetical protein [Luteipulveratus mongoliensis]
MSHLQEQLATQICAERNAKVLRPTYDEVDKPSRQQHEAHSPRLIIGWLMHPGTPRSAR